MKMTHSFTKTILHAALLTMLASLTGCGGDDDKPKTQICMLFLIIPVPCSSGSSAPEQQPISAQSPTTPAGSEKGTNGGDETRPVVMNSVDEFEPNTTLDNANVVQFLTAPLDSSVGINIKGSVQETDDAADFFIFTPDRSDRYGIYLCADTCGAFVQDDAVYVMLYDQYQTTIAGTPVGTIAEQMVSAELTAGLAYYVEVHGYNTGATSYSYQLVIID